ncbi:uncharacterized protein DS421_16g544470 [Arachis hypogaea]|nr:uncharacterized protein DS421_16g544470 [Arachis hypogaea]
MKRENRGLGIGEEGETVASSVACHHRSLLLSHRRKRNRGEREPSSRLARAVVSAPSPSSAPRAATRVTAVEAPRCCRHFARRGRSQREPGEKGRDERKPDREGEGAVFGSCRRVATVALTAPLSSSSQSQLPPLIAKSER